jgi:hypothetical protein
VKGLWRGRKMKSYVGLTLFLSSLLTVGIAGYDGCWPNNDLVDNTFTFPCTEKYHLDLSSSNSLSDSVLAPSSPNAKQKNLDAIIVVALIRF